MQQSVQDLLPYLREIAFAAGFVGGSVFAALCCMVYRQC